MNTYENLIQAIQNHIAINTTPAPIFVELIEQEVCEEVWSRRMTQEQANEILALVAQEEMLVIFQEMKSELKKTMRKLCPNYGKKDYSYEVCWETGMGDETWQVLVECHKDRVMAVITSDPELIGLFEQLVDILEQD